MREKGLVAGFYASVIALIFGHAVGGLGIWSAVAATSRTPLGGALVLLIIGAFLGYLYSYVEFGKFFGKEAIVKGVTFGVGVWLLTLIVASIFPILAERAFAVPLRANLFVQLLTHVVWGAGLGMFYEQR